MKELTPDEHKILVDAIQDSATVVHKGRKDMNERIRELAEQAFFDENTNQPSDKMYTFTEHKMKQFAELIVRECVGIVAKRKDQAIDDGWNVDEAMSMAEMDLEEHFGVEE